MTPSFFRSLLILTALATVPASTAAAQRLDELTDAGKLADVLEKADLRKPENLPPRGAKAAVVSCIVYTNDVSSLSTTSMSSASMTTTTIWSRYNSIGNSGKTQLAEALCPDLVRAIETELPFEWMPDEQVFALEDVKSHSDQPDTYAGFGDFGVVSADNGGGGNFVWKRGDRKSNRRLPANDYKMRELTKKAGVDMVFIAAVLLTPNKKGEIEINSIEVGGYGEPKGAGIRVISPFGRPWTQADVGVRLKRDLKLTADESGLHTQGYQQLATALLQKLGEHVSATAVEQ